MTSDTTFDRLVKLKDEIQRIYEELYAESEMSDTQIQELTLAVEREVEILAGNRSNGGRR